MTNRQRELITILTKKISRIIEHHEQRESSPIDSLIRLALGERIRGLRSIRPVGIIKAKNNDPRAIVAEKISRKQKSRINKNIKEQIDILSDLLKQEGGKSDPKDKHKLCTWRSKPIWHKSSFI